MTDYDDMLDRSKQGKVTSEELAEVKAHLEKGTAPVHRYKLLYIVGRSFDTSAKELVESFLACPDEPDLSRLALQILCSFWDWTGQYLDYVAEFVVGVPWDPDGTVRDMALSVAGHYLREHNNLELLALVLSVAGDDAKREEEPVTWDAAIDALAHALGYDYRDLPDAAKGFDPDAPLTQEILAKARERLRSGG